MKRDKGRSVFLEALVSCSNLYFRPKLKNVLIMEKICVVTGYSIKLHSWPKQQQAVFKLKKKKNLQIFDFFLSITGGIG